MEWKFSKKQLLPPVLSGSTLKWIAIVTMLIDHIGAVLFENGFIKAYNQQLSGAFSYSVTHAVWYADIWMRRIGRVAFPIFCFLLVEGFSIHRIEKNMHFVWESLHLCQRFPLI